LQSDPTAWDSWSRDYAAKTELANFPSDSFDIPDLHESGFLRTDKRGE
jgi:hypothetical protein